jgi:single-strand DNA-binding protein
MKNLKSHATTAVATIVVLLTLSSVTTSGAYSYSSGSMYGSMKRASFRIRDSASNRIPTFASTAFRRVEKCNYIDGGNNKKKIASGDAFVATLLFSSSGEGDENERENETNSNSDGVPDISATQGDVDFMSVNDIDWAEMDPFHELPFDEYEDLYLKGNAKGDDSTKSNPNCDASYESIMTEWDDSVPTLNHISLVGRVGNPPEARYFDSPVGAGSGSGGNYNSNKPNVVVSMSLALPRYYSAWEREQYGIEFGQEETEWYNLEVWGYLAEFAMKNVQKGSRIGVVGSIDTDYYRNKNNNLLSTSQKVLVQDLDILESKMEADARRNNNYSSNNNYSGGNNNYSGGAGAGGAGYNSNTSNRSNNNMYEKGQQRDQERGPSFFTDDDDDDDDDDDSYDPSEGDGGSAGGFFDPT